MFGFLRRIFGTAQDRQIKKYWKVVELVNKEELKLQSLSPEEIQNKTSEFRARLKQGASIDSLLVEAYAVVKNACRRLSGTPIHVSGYDQLWDMVPFDVQILSGIAMHAGSISEMQTGEGKTLTAVLPLYLNALTGKPVHLVTVNDYLAQRDCEWVGSVLRWLGITTAVLTSETPPQDRHEIYKADVVYGTASEFGFDYLRDNSMASRKEDQVQRGYYFALIDEVDSILIDEARTPLIISGPAAESKQLYLELKDAAHALVKKQRDLCNTLANDAKKVLDAWESRSDKESASAQKERKQALHRLWQVSRGMPRHKVLSKLKENPELRAELDQCDLYFHSEQNKEEKYALLDELYLNVEERSHDFELTDKGIHTWPECALGNGSVEDFVMHDLGYEFQKIDDDSSLSDEQKVEAKLRIQEEDADKKERSHTLRQMLRAHLMMECDVDYIVQEEKIVIVDENTGRPQPGRRFSDGLHQAIEAKEGVSIQKETQTYAQITLQNYFRMYEKLSGMTGTALTEAQEFKEIYKLDVLRIPPNKPSRRLDYNDEVYMTEREKYAAIVLDIKKANEEGRPVLVGTESVDVSEKLSRILRTNKVEHTVLNARHHEREAEIIAHAGKRGAVTIATNMAGRGTDIKLEPGIAELGGLYVIGSTRHRSRRIDRQLLGRSGRQGDPGASKFYLSFEDELLRLYAGSSLTGLIQRFRPEEGEAISHRMLNRSIEIAQERIEKRNYTIRKHTLEYDDVMNLQRKEVYSYRNAVLGTPSVATLAPSILKRGLQGLMEPYAGIKTPSHEWRLEDFRKLLMETFPVSFREDFFNEDFIDVIEPFEKAFKQVEKTLSLHLEEEMRKIKELEEKGVRFSFDMVVRDIMIRIVDRLWQEHLQRMDQLRTEVSIRAVGQRDPLMEYKQEAFTLFQKMILKIQVETLKALFAFKIVFKPQNMAPVINPSMIRFDNHSMT